MAGVAAIDRLCMGRGRWLVGRTYDVWVREFGGVVWVSTWLEGEGMVDRMG